MDDTPTFYDWLYEKFSAELRTARPNHNLAADRIEHFVNDRIMALNTLQLVKAIDAWAAATGARSPLIVPLLHVVHTEVHHHAGGQRLR